MVVDDDAAMLALVEWLLKRHELTVTTNDNPQEVVNLLPSITPDLFIIDLMMPQVNGVELCRKIRACSTTRHTPIIILSARHDVDVMRQGLEAGANMCLSKSTLHTNLIQNVTKLLNASVK